MSRWTLVRHAESTANAARCLSGHQDVPLSKAGHRQALALAEALSDDAFDRVIGSDLLRVRQTADPVLARHNLTPLWLPELRERDFGTWSGRSIDEARRTLEFPDWREAVLTWDQAPPDGETWQELSVRVLTALAMLDAPGHTLVVTHGGVIRMLCGLLEGEAKSRIPLRKVDNTEVVRLELTVGTWLRVLQRVDGLA